MQPQLLSACFNSINYININMCWSMHVSRGQLQTSISESLITTPTVVFRQSSMCHVLPHVLHLHYHCRVPCHIQSLNQKVHITSDLYNALLPPHWSPDGTFRPCTWLQPPTCPLPTLPWALSAVIEWLAGRCSPATQSVAIHRVGEW